MIEEIWKDIQGYEGFYQVSNLGRVKSLDRIVRNNSGFFVRKGKILKPQENSRKYLRVELKVKNNSKRFFVHRLVAKHFIHKPQGYNIVNHLDCNPHNNKASNLEWTTAQGNMDYMNRLGRNKRTNKWIENLTESERKKFGKAVIGVSISDTKVLKYETLNQVKKDGFQPSCVSCCCNKKRLTHRGYVWRFANE